VDTFEEAERRTLLSVVDSRWREHLYEMDYLREGIGWRGLSQRDPLVEYKREGFDIFQEMERGLKEDYVTYIYRVENIQLREEEMQQLVYSGGEEEVNQRPSSPRKRTEAKIGRNEPCPCGSGKKYKKCHGMPGAPPLTSEVQGG
jgi:preprotein translocase subunit SecA